MTTGVDFSERSPRQRVAMELRLRYERAARQLRPAAGNIESGEELRGGSDASRAGVVCHHVSDNQQLQTVCAHACMRE